MLKFFIPIVPIGKGRARASVVAGTAHLYTPEKTLTNEAEIRFLVRNMLPNHVPYEGPVAVELTFYIPRAKSNKTYYPTKKPDIDNAVKQVFDAFNGVVWVDDVQVISLTTWKLFSSGGRVGIEVFVKPLNNEYAPKLKSAKSKKGIDEFS